MIARTLFPFICAASLLLSGGCVATTSEGLCPNGECPSSGNGDDTSDSSPSEDEGPLDSYNVVTAGTDSNTGESNTDGTDAGTDATDSEQVSGDTASDSNEPVDTGEPVQLGLYDEDTIAPTTQSYVLDDGNNIKQLQPGDAASGTYVMQVEIQDGTDGDNTGAVGYMFDTTHTAVNMTRSDTLQFQARLVNGTCDFSIGLLEDLSTVSSYRPVSDLTASWATYTLPLDDFTDVNHQFIRGLAFTGTNTAFCQVQIDAIEIY